MLKEWSKRNNITPNQVDVLSNVHVLWECTNCHGEYSCSLFEKTDRSCPFCSNREKLQDFNTLNETHPYLREFWDLSNERDFSEYWFKSNNVVSWVCPCCKINFQCSPAEMIKTFKHVPINVTGGLRYLKIIFSLKNQNSSKNGAIKIKFLFIYLRQQ